MEPFELFSIRYARNGPRPLGQNMICGEPHAMHSSLNFYAWVAKRRGDLFRRAPADPPRLLDLDHDMLEDIILTHIHYDHAGMLYRYPKATFLLQDSKLAYATGSCMCSKLLRRGYEGDDVLDLVRRVYANRVAFPKQSVEITPRLPIHRTGGHTWAADGAGLDPPGMGHPRVRCAASLFQQDGGAPLALDGARRRAANAEPFRLRVIN